jgi:hypothetical protein
MSYPCRPADTSMPISSLYNQIENYQQRTWISRAMMELNLVSREGISFFSVPEPTSSPSWWRRRLLWLKALVKDWPRSTLVG